MNRACSRRFRRALRGLGLWSVILVTLLPGRLPGQEDETVEESDGPALVVIEEGTERAERMLHEVSNQLGSWFSENTGTLGRYTVFGFELWRFVSFFVVLLLTLFGARVVRMMLERYGSRAIASRIRIHRTLFMAAGAPTQLFTTAIGLYLATLPVLYPFGAGVYRSIGRISLAVAAAAVLWYVYRLVDIVDQYLSAVASRTDNDLDDMFVQAVRRTLRALIVVLGVLFISQTILQWNITALLASAGVAGLAIAFAAQDTIANFFGSFMLLLDRPFKVGERVVVNGSEGFVEGLAFRSTRVRTLDGHLVSIPNKIVANEKIENIGRRPFIRRVANITVTYDTPVAKLERGVSCIKEILARHGHMHPDMPPRVYFSDFNDWSLNILMVAWYKPERGPVEEWWEYLEWCEQVNFDIMRAFEAEGIEFAFPTNTTYLAHDPRRELTIATVPLPGSGGAE